MISYISINIESCDLQTQLHRSMTGNKRPWRIQYNDYGEVNYSYISGWAMQRLRLQLYSLQDRFGDS